MKGRFITKSKDCCPFCGGLRLEPGDESIIFDPLRVTDAIGQSKTRTCYTCCKSWIEHSLDLSDEILIVDVDKLEEDGEDEADTTIIDEDFIEYVAEDLSKVAMDNGLLESKVKPGWDEYDEITFIFDYGNLEDLRELYDLMSPYADDDLCERFQSIMENKS